MPNHGILCKTNSPKGGSCTLNPSHCTFDSLMTYPTVLVSIDTDMPINIYAWFMHGKVTES